MTLTTVAGRDCLSRRAANLSPSPTLTIDAKAKEMKASGLDVVGFGAGEPDFDTPAGVKAAGIRAIEAGKTKYTPAAGTLELRQSICDKLQRDNGLEYKPSQIVVSNGAKHSLYNIMLILLDEGDEVIVPAPYWVSYNEQIKLCGGVPVVVSAGPEQGYRITADQLEAAVTPRTRAIILNSPSNPTGSVYSRAELEALARVIVKRDLICVSDEIYEKLIYEGEHVSIASLGEDIKDHTIVVNGVSKSHSMTGWRIGYVAADQKLATAMADLQSQTTSNPASMSQAAALEAMRTKPSEEMLSEFRRRRDFMVERLNGMPGVTCLKPAGSFYVFPDISGLIGRRSGDKALGGSADVAGFFLEKALAAVVPGDAFGSDANLRLSYAISMADIEKGLSRMAEAIETLV